MRRSLLPLLLPALLAACGQMPTTTPGATTPGATTPGTPTQQALPGVFQIDFGGVGTDTPTSRVQSLQPSGLHAQGLISAPDQFGFSRVSVQTFTSDSAGIRHIRVTYKVTNTSSQTLRNPKLVAVVPQGSITDSIFTNVRYFDGSDASTAISNLSLIQAQSFDTSTGSVAADPQANALLTGLDVSQVDNLGKGIKTLTQTGWWLTTPPTLEKATFMAPGDSSLITFGVNVPMTSAANGGATKDPFSFSLNVTAVQDAPPLVALSSAVKQWDGASKTFGNYVRFPTQTYRQNGSPVTRSLPAYYDINELNSSTTAKILCGDDTNMSVTNISTTSFRNRWRVQLLSLGAHTLNVFEGTTCPASGTPLLSQTVMGVGTSGTSLSAGSEHNLALKMNGTVQSWGSNRYGQLGDGTITSRNTPIPVSGLSGITSIAGGINHSLALKADRTVQSWGYNNVGQLGDGTTSQRNTPVTVNGLSAITSIAGGGGHSLALRADGIVQSWGQNNFGQLGNGTTVGQTSPVTVSGLGGITSIAAGNTYSLALRADGIVWGWGANDFGQLGNGNLTQQNTPVSVGGLSDIVSISASDSTSLALSADGTVWSWGYNRYGQLGNGTTTDRRTPGMVSGLSDVVSIVSAASGYSLALRKDGTVQSWGRNDSGQLGDGTTTDRSTPGPVSDLTEITSIGAGAGHSLALKGDGTVWSWGKNAAGQLGDGTTANRSTPGAVGALSGVAQPTP